ncbi:MAG: type II secretion system protein N [Betaproteobacteria bacterium]|nr:type II secretion system protein N [Betaproteobacteria bacterium]
MGCPSPGSRARTRPAGDPWPYPIRMATQLNRSAPGGAAAPRPLRRLAWTGALSGALLAAVTAAPATWMAVGLERLTDGRLQGRDATGTVWDGQVTLALGAGPGSGPAWSMPGRLSWQLRPTLGATGWPGLTMTVQHPLLMPQPARVQAQPGWKSWALEMHAAHGDGPVRAEVPAAWLAGLGAPWNTLQPSGQLLIQWDRLSWASGPSGPAALDLALRIHMVNMASRVSTLAVLGDYELRIEGGPVVGARLSSRPGSALVLDGQGQWSPGGPASFRGQASALAGREEALSNLLNIIGRRDGPRSLMAFGSPGLDGQPPAPTQ